MYRSTFAHLHTDYAPPVMSANPVETAPPRRKRRRRSGRSRLILALRPRSTGVG